ncbi:DUF4145 domain-containing protein [Vibrio diabolicus]|uniref:DUF4145 domain-containing protein n=1 Tax=Vibrio diabolicus TaxID=50719 RepID=UPI0021518E7F|nr:DUF4145 domain-containing protein [Vibrio diabolicus]MCE3221800.1 DUF4145 domain-containing protein [Vibrio diabolicus]
MDEIKKIHCNTCCRTTNHVAKSKHTKMVYFDLEDGFVDESSPLEESEYTFWICMGCDSACLEDKYTCAGMNDGHDQVYISTFYPEHTFSYREPKSFLHISTELDNLYRDIITSYRHDLAIPTAMAIRTLLEAICIEQGISDDIAWKFHIKIEKLNKIIGMPQSITEGLLALKFMGDSAAHKLISPQMKDLSLAIDLLEALLLHLYEARFDLQSKATQMHQSYK